MDFFEKPAQTLGQNPIIVLIDASGSTTSEYLPPMTINQKMEQIIQALPTENYRLIFWNSDYPDPEINRDFRQGVITLPYVVSKASLKPAFAHVRSKIRGCCYTYPHVGFRAIPNEWIDDKSPTHIYFVTDGVMGPPSACSIGELKNHLRREIEQLFKRHNNVHLHLVTVERQNYDFGAVETLQVSAGGDVFEVIRSNQLTKYITEFVCYTPKYVDGYRHINTVIPPAGYIPFIDNYFSETKMPQFVRYLSDLIHKTSDEDQLLKIIQSLSTTLRFLTKDKPQHLVESTVRHFCDLFNGSVIEPSMVQFILSDSVMLEQQGKAIVFSQYRARLRDLYKQAQALLEQNSKNALGLNQEFISLPIDDKVVYGHQMLVTESIHLTKSTYPNSSIMVNQTKIPVIPLLTSDQMSPLNEQCLRQFTRAIVGQQYHVDQMGDIVIHVVLGLALRAKLSPIDPKYKKAYQYLARVMLRKKRLNTDTTELERLINGELPIPNNGKMDQFYGFMDVVARLLGLHYRPMTLWYLLCSVLDSQELMTKQLIHCADALAVDFPNIEPQNLLTSVTITPIQVYEKSLTDYKCIITLEDCSTDGGYLFCSHTSPTGATCSPVFVVSKHGHQMLVDRGQILCPVCYQDITVQQFRPIGPKSNDDATIFPDGTKSPFGRTHSEPEPSQTQPSQPQPSQTQPSQPQPSQTQPSRSNQRKYLVILKGTVGAGKSTFADRLKTVIEQNGGMCLVEGTDRYCVAGHSIQSACQQVTAHLSAFKGADHPFKVVIIDTCGDRDTGSKAFNVDFRDWKLVRVYPNYTKDKMRGYLAWSLRNVLRRESVTTDSKYYLNPVSAGLKVCMDVHRKKATSLWKQNVLLSSGSTIEEVIKDLDTEANAYADFLAQSMPLDQEVATLVQKLN
jgi:hypothetical protein